MGGTEKWTYTLARQFQSAGHDVEVWCFLPGLTSDKLEAIDIPVLQRNSCDGRVYDLKLVNQNTCLPMVQGAEGYTVFTSHGPLHNLEYAPSGADQYVAVSPEVQEQVEKAGHASTVIYNGLDLEEFSPRMARPEGPTRVLSLCKSVATSWMLKDACKELEWGYTWVNYLQRPVWDVANLIQPHDIVVGCGRSALEGLACGKSVLVFDGRTEEPRADGWITRQNVDTLRQKNFACRTHNHYWHLPDLVEALKQWEPQDWSREWCMEHADVRKKAAEYLSLLPTQVHQPDLTAEYT